MDTPGRLRGVRHSGHFLFGPVPLEESPRTRSFKGRPSYSSSPHNSQFTCDTSSERDMQPRGVPPSSQSGSSPTALRALPGPEGLRAWTCAASRPVSAASGSPNTGHGRPGARAPN